MCVGGIVEGDAKSATDDTDDDLISDNDDDDNDNDGVVDNEDTMDDDADAPGTVGYGKLDWWEKKNPGK